MITVPSLSDKPLESRRSRMTDILSSGKVIRFHYHRPGDASFYKDVDSLDGIESDLKAFRRTGGLTAEHTHPQTNDNE